MEVESAFVHHQKVAEAAVVGKPDDIKGEGISCFVTLSRRSAAHRGTEEGITGPRRKEIGSLARPDEIRFTDPCPKHAPAKSCAACCATSPAASNDRRYDDAFEDYGVLAKLSEEEE